MDRKEVLVYFSDCHFFAGCENMIPNFLNSEKLNKKYCLHFVYRKSISYENELKKRIKNHSNIHGINLLKMNIHRSLYKFLKWFPILYKFISFFIIFFWKYFSILYSLFPLYKILKKINPDIIHINNGGYPAAYTSYSMILLARLIKVKRIIYVVNNIAEGYKNPLRWLDYFIDKFVISSVDFFVTGSNNAKLKLRHNINVPVSKTINIANGIELRNVKDSKLNVFRKLNIELNSRLVFSVIALLEKRKGHIWLLKSINLLIKKYGAKNLPLFIFEGIGPEKNILENYIKKNNLSETVKLIGNFENIFDLINASDAIILPSIENEDFPNIIIEGMGMGKPAIGSKIAGIPEQIDNGKNGFLVEPKDPDDLSQKILQIMNKNLLRKFSFNSKQKFKLNYKVSISIDKYIKLYKY